MKMNHQLSSENVKATNGRKQSKWMAYFSLFPSYVAYLFRLGVNFNKLNKV